MNQLSAAFVEKGPIAVEQCALKFRRMAESYLRERGYDSRKERIMLGKLITRALEQGAITPQEEECLRILSGVGDIGAHTDLLDDYLEGVCNLSFTRAVEAAEALGINPWYYLY